MYKKIQIAKLSILSNTVLISIKLLVGIISGSVSMISEAIHSCIDLIAALISFFSVKVSDTPPDEEHPYGHGKYENVSGVIEALLIFAAAICIIYEAIVRIKSNQHIVSIGLASVVMLVAAIVNFFVSSRLYKVAKETESIALEADALHLKTDMYSSIGVATGLFLIWITGYYFLDPVIAILVALFILRESYYLLKSAYNPLLDTALSIKEINIIKNSIINRSLSYHDLKTRKSGHFRFADVHLEMNENIKLKEVHELCDEIEQEIKTKIQNLEITIHVEPFH